MKNLFTILLASSLMVCTSAVFAQKNFTSTLDALLDSEFMKQYQEIRTSAMASATAFKNSNQGYSPDQVQRVEEGYNKVADKFNFVLLRLKNDMLSKDKMKYIEKFPDEYQRLLKLDMIELRDFYAVNYQQVLAEVKGDEVDGAVLLLISDILLSSANVYSLVKNMVEYIKFNKRRAKKIRTAELEKRLVKPHKFTMWYELGRESMGGGRDYDSGNQDMQAPSDNVQFERIETRQRFEGDKTPDRDHDGVADTQDRCPDTYGSAEAFGCPDSDRDGIADELDKCPYEYGYKEYNGCADGTASFNSTSSNSNTSSSNSSSNPSTNKEDIDGAKLKKNEKIKIKVPKKKKNNN